MAHYVQLINFTDQGIRNVKDTTKRADAFRETAKAAGITVKDIYWTLGAHDLVSIVEAKDEMALTALGLTLGKGGNIRTQTLRAFTQAEMGQILTKVT
jgi:uncharacterized protein with GYD domain